MSSMVTIAEAQLKNQLVLWCGLWVRPKFSCEYGGSVSRLLGRGATRVQLEGVRLLGACSSSPWFPFSSLYSFTHEENSFTPVHTPFLNVPPCHSLKAKEPFSHGLKPLRLWTRLTDGQSIICVDIYCSFQAILYPLTQAGQCSFRFTR